MVDKGIKSRRKRTERKAILTETEQKNIKSGKMNSKVKSKLYSKLDQRLSALIDDLDLIAKSETLRTWRQLKKYQFNSEFSKLAKIFEDLAGSEFTKIYLDRIHSYKNSKGKKIYWLEKSSSDRILDKLWKKKKPYYSERIFHPENILRGLKESKITKELLIQAYYLRLIPLRKEEAREIKIIQKMIEAKKRKTAKKKRMPKCKTCGYRYSAKCPECRKRFHNKFKYMLNEMNPNEYVMFQSINTNSY